ncbi:putative uncharacterized protein [Parachlamydia acanthamoebae UV-7]|jgi:hypothetical protein|uniref:Uncharacterized protein n=2 Tax=Parachlamydia acanthamoebae TaxID=83552 RepID=F8KX20_PARAV|nr:hypothetical protein [Parachlamydia acanthamoebae]CCB85487.1 putative uncharacterized protein [Parachlamydia acanthamoebae UV-7]
MMVPPGSGSLEPHIPPQISQVPMGSRDSLPTIDSEPLIGDATTHSPPSITTISDLMKKIDRVLAAHGLSRDQASSASQFKISMHFERPTDDPDGVLIKTWEMQIKDKEKKYSESAYCVPMKVEISFTDGKPSETFDYSFRTDISVPTAPPRPALRNGKEIKGLLASTTTDARRRAMYMAYMDALSFRHLVKASVNSQDPQYVLARQKVDTFIRTKNLLFSPMVHLEESRQWEETHKALKTRKIETMGIGVKEGDSEQFYIDFRKKIPKTANIGERTFKNAAEKYSNVHLQLDSEDPAVKIPETIAKLVPPTDPKLIPAFEQTLKNAGISPRNLLDYWPDHIESDYEKFKEKSKLFMSFSSGESKLGKIKNLVGNFLPVRGTARLRKLKSEIEKYEKDIDSGSLSPSSKKIPRSRLGQLKKTRDRLILEQQGQAKNKNDDEINQFRLDILNSKRPADSQVSLDEFKALPTSAVSLIDKEWEATLPTLDGSTRKRWEDILESKSDELKNAKKEFNELKQLLLDNYREFKSEHNELKRLSTEISARLNWLSKNIPANTWETYPDADKVSKNLSKIFKLTSNAPSRFKKIQKIFTPNDIKITNIENA